jgi:hypothetical protein
MRLGLSPSFNRPLCTNIDQLFTDVLRAYYKHQELPGHAFVTRGDYQIVLDHRIVEANQWSIMVRPDSTVAMSMILRRRGDTMVKCPRCGAAPRGERVSGWANWSVTRRWDQVIADKEFSSSCPGLFRATIEEDKEEEMISPAISAEADPDPNQRSVPERRATTPRQDTPEAVWKRFRLLSIVSHVRRISNPKVKVDEVPKKKCQKCGRAGRYEHGQYTEEWGPGPQGPETLCEECIRSPDPPPKENIKDTNISDNDATSTDPLSMSSRKRKKGLNEKEGKITPRAPEKKKPSSSYWTVADRDKLKGLIELHGDDFDSIASELSQKSGNQVRNLIRGRADLARILDQVLKQRDNESALKT